MTHQEYEWFNQLRDRQIKDAGVFDSPRYRGVWSTVVDKYSDKAHFIYELLQNADDAGATFVRLELRSDGLVFRHNGKKPFTVSNPETEEEDHKVGRLGHVNAITSIGMSQKMFEKGEANQIGKFGVGFKSVFQYADTPHIYDDNIQFKITSRIVPTLITQDFPGRNASETVFVLPFDRDNKESAYLEVKEKVDKLQFALLFLNNLIEIQYVVGDLLCTYSKNCGTWKNLEYDVNGIKVKAFQTCLVNLKQPSGDSLSVQIFTRRINGKYDVAVGYVVDESETPIPFDGVCAFCFFQTDIPTGLRFFIHAPFLLTDNRQGIKDDYHVASDGVRIKGHNGQMIEAVIELAADAIWAFSVLGPNRLTEKIINVIPARTQDFQALPQDNPFKKELDLIQRKFISVFRNFPVIPSNGSFVMARDCFWPYNQGLEEVFTSDKVQRLFGPRKVNWAFSSYCGSRNGFSLCVPITAYNPRKMLYRFNCGTLGHFLREVFDNPIALVHMLKAFPKNFMQNQTDEWRLRLYRIICECNLGKEFLSRLELLPDQMGQIVPAYDERGNEQLWLPTEGASNVYMVKEALLENVYVQRLVSILELKKVVIPSLKDQILQLIKKDLSKTNDSERYKQAFRKVFNFYDEDLSSRCDVVRTMRSCCYLVAFFYEYNKNCYYHLPSQKNEVLYFKTPEFDEYLNGLETACSIDLSFYASFCGAESQKGLKTFFKDLGVRDVLLRMDLKDGPGINYCCKNFRRLGTLLPHEKIVANCKATWNLLVDFIRDRCKENKPFLHLMMYKPKNEDIVIPSKTLEMLRTTSWIIDSGGNVNRPADVCIEELDPFYEFDTWPARQLAEAIGLRYKRNDVLKEEDHKDLDLGRKAKAMGITIEEIDKFLEWRRCRETISSDTSGQRTSETIDAGANGVANSLGLATIALGDGQYTGLSEEDRIRVNEETIEFVKRKLTEEGFDFSNSTDVTCGINGAIDKQGKECPLVVHSNKKNASELFLSSADIQQLGKPNALLVVRVEGDKLVKKTLLQLIEGRERLDLSFSVTNFTRQERLERFSQCLRWFSGLRFKFDVLRQEIGGVMQFYDCPTNGIPENKKELELAADTPEGVF